MPSPSYLILRFIRHILPESGARFLLRQGWIIRPGLETCAPLEAVQRYQDALAGLNCSLKGSRVLILGYGGKFALGCELLKRGAGHVVLTEKEGFINHRANLSLLPDYSKYLKMENGKVLPDPQYVTLLHGDIREIANRGTIPAADFVFSNSVYEHLGDVEGITAAITRLSKPDAAHIHFVDLRDHFFKFPFEMLCYSSDTWQRWLNPTSNHNRYRTGDYKRVFEKYFQRVEITVLDRDLAAFEHTKGRIRPEFLTGDDKIDSVTLIKITAVSPK